MYTDKELLKIQNFARSYEEALERGEVAKDIQILMEILGEIPILDNCPRCGCFNMTFFGEGGNIPDGRVTCTYCRLSTKYHKHTSKKFDFRFNKYRDMRSALADWTHENLYDYGAPDGHWERDCMDYFGDLFSGIER